MTRWAIPYVDQPVDFWQEIMDRFGEQVEEVYFPMPGFASGRGKQPSEHLKGFLKQRDLPKSILINPIVLPMAVEEAAPHLIEPLTKYHEVHGINSVVVANLDLAHLIREAIPAMTINLSTLAGIEHPAQIAMLGDVIDGLVPSNLLVRDIERLRALREAFAGKLRLIVNESCIPGCPYRMQHFFEMGYCDGAPKSLCARMLAQNPWLRLTGAWILPQHLHHYDGLYDSLKLAGRVTLQDHQRYLTVLEAYITRQPLTPDQIGGGPASVQHPIDIPDDFFEHLITCNKHCQDCTVCRDFYAGALAKIGEAV